MTNAEVGPFSEQLNYHQTKLIHILLRSIYYSRRKAAEGLEAME